MIQDVRALLSDCLNAIKHHIVSEIAVTWCSVSPSQNWGMCDPETTAQDDSHKGKWVRVERNLNLEGGFLSGHLVCAYRPAPCAYSR